MRIWGIAVPVFILLLLIPLSIEYRLAHPNVPPGLQRSECLAPTIGGENWKDNFLRRGGRITPSTGAQWQGDAYSSPSIAQGRDLRKYDTLELRDRDHFHPSQRVSHPDHGPSSHLSLATLENPPAGLSDPHTKQRRPHRHGTYLHRARRQWSLARLLEAD